MNNISDVFTPSPLPHLRASTGMKPLKYRGAGSYKRLVECKNCQKSRSLLQSHRINNPVRVCKSLKTLSINLIHNRTITIKTQN